MRPPQRLDGVIGNLRESDDGKIGGCTALFVMGSLFFVQSVVIAALFALQKNPVQSLDSLAGSLFGCFGCWLWAWYLSRASHKRRWLKRALITLVVVFGCTGLVLSAIQFCHERRVEGQAKQWFTQAQEDAKPTWNQGDAVRWVHDHGMRPYQGEGSGASGHYYIVDGYRRIEEGGRMFRPASLKMSFLFDLDHKFRRAEYRVEPFVPPDRWQR
jgi:hypothetical protein